MPMTVQQVVDRARSRHVRFRQAEAPEGFLLQAVDDRQRTIILQHGGAIEGLVSSSVQLALTISGNLVGVTAGGTPQYLTTYQDGWPVHMTAGLTPYINTTESTIAGDPFGEHGGTPGFPLPADFLKLIQLVAVYTGGQVGPIEIVAEPMRLALQRISTPTAFISGNRIIPIRPLTSGNSGDAWSASITSVQLGYVALPVLATMSDVIVLPAALTEMLVTGVAEVLAAHTPGMTATDQSAFAQSARRSEETLSDYSLDMLGTASTTTVRYRR
jgi:hypothetical protein